MLRACRDAGVHVTVQGGRTSLVAGTVPEHDDVLLSTERLTDIGEVDTVERRVRVGAGATLADVQRAATKAGLVFGVDIAARDSATVGGMASTNAGGLRTVRYGNMGEQVIGLDVVLPDGSIVRAAQPSSAGQHRIRPGIAVRRRRGHARRHHRPGSATASHADAPGDRGLRVRRSRRPRRRGPRVPRYGRHRRAGVDRRPRQRTDRRAPRCGRARARAPGSCSIELAGDTDQTEQLGRRAGERAADRRARGRCRRQLRSSGCGRSANRSPRSSASTARR